ncbi:conserved hypothetical protein [Hyella patelloides LEGE 07179]|uniref:Uncharacterized protein n=1 Tax=Hyella patelloides LEGE 07179 TaxID=945734 RepID=A0A563W5K2_9CYAN|nr:hypothetical protein [Hyella patelloides]VEP18981.1 conserved hypothetical protein [Hyella patelloides LEGE 07179]
MIKNQKNSSCNTVNPEKIIYEYLRDYLKTHTVEESILEYRCIFLEGTSQNVLVRNIMEDIICSKIKQEKFFFILNYCFYIAINYWLRNNENEEYIIQLTQLFDRVDYTSTYYSRRKRKLLSLTQKFVNSKHHQKIKRIALILDYKPLIETDNNTLVDNLLSRYTYLYKPLLIGKENITELTDLIHDLQVTRTKSFELQLAQHIIYRTRLIEVAKAQQFSHGAGKIIRRSPNPTLLSNQDLRVVLKQYIKKIDKKITLYQLSRKFVVNNKRDLSYREFKRNLYFYLTFNIKPTNPNYNFEKKLWNLLDSIYYQSDTLLINNNLTLRTFRKLYQHLIISNSDKKKHDLLIKLISNLGTAQTVMLLIKIVLICPHVKTDLEQRLAQLYSCYEGKSLEDVPWMVKFLEHFLIAFSIYFGKIDISLAKAM